MARKKLRELTSAKVDFVSLVKRGANRIPFRIIKQDKESKMGINLSEIFSKNEDVKSAEVVGFAVSEHIDSQKAAELIKDAGFDVSEIAEQDGGSLIKTGESVDDEIVIRLSEDVCAVVAHVQKSFQSYTSSPVFKDVISQQGVYPSMMVAQDALNTTIGNILYLGEGEKPELISLVAVALEDYRGYVLALLGAVPMEAFKAELLDAIESTKQMDGGDDMSDEDKKKKKGKTKQKKSGESQLEGSDSPTANVNKEDGGEESETGVVKKGDDAIINDKETEMSSEDLNKEDVAKSDDEVTKETDAAKEDAKVDVSKEDPVLAALTALTKSVEAIGTQVSDLTGRVDGVETLAKTVKEEVNSVVGGDATNDDVNAQKSEPESYGMIDTAREAVTTA